MTVTPTLSFDLLLGVAGHFGYQDSLNLSLAQQVLHEPLTRRAFTVALTVPFNHDLKPVTYAIENGDIQLFSKAVSFLDSLFPSGWQWSQFYANGVGRLLTLAAARNLESLQYLSQKYPLIPGPSDGALVPANLVPVSVLEHGFYSVANTYTPAWVNVRNQGLVVSALKGGRYDCASFLLDHQPSLFPNGFPLRGDPTCYSSATTLEFLIDHGAILGGNPLHIVAELTDIHDTQVFDVLVQRGFGVDSPLETFRDSPMGVMFTPLHQACRRLQPISVGALLRLGADPNGITSNFLIAKAPLMTSFQYFSPSPILTLLLSTRWDLAVWDNFEGFGRRFIDCFQSLLRYGATTLIPLLNGDLLEILLLRIWRILYKQITRQTNFVLPSCENRPHDLNQGVRSLLLAFSHANVYPWDHVCQAVCDTNTTWSGNAGQFRGKELLIKLLSEYQDKYGDLPGLDQLRLSSLLELPDRYGAQLATQ
ncbi:hypothetical protein F4801DRAFT_541616 [Xylaria longipes]|nr:hypothetical protein F4801DRAFT_541616 [Xylaria longipes]